jgi:hypothetical protein
VTCTALQGLLNEEIKAIGTRAVTVSRIQAGDIRLKNDHNTADDITARLKRDDPDLGNRSPRHA